MEKELALYPAVVASGTLDISRGLGDEPNLHLGNHDDEQSTKPMKSGDESEIRDLLARSERSLPNAKMDDNQPSAKRSWPKQALATNEPPPESEDIVDRLAKFAELRANGTLTLEEFNELKADLIGPPTKKPPSINEYIKRLRSARDSGAITEDEFHSKVLASLIETNSREAPTRL